MKQKIILVLSLALIMLILFQYNSIAVDTNPPIIETEVTEETTVPPVVIEVEEKIMYSMVALNVRSGAGIEFDTIGYFNVNDEVKVLAVCDGAWSRIEYQGQEAYVSSKYLSDNKIEMARENSSDSMDTVSVAAEIASRNRMIGRLVIPSVGLDVALFNSYTQGVVDRQDSAGTYRHNGGQMIIADHKNQGFSAMKSSVPYETIAYINDGETITSYICIVNNVGSNKSNGIPYDLLDCNKNSIYFQNAGGICMYTCNDHWSRITYTYWQPI